jgi:hypothetical protein
MAYKDYFTESTESIAANDTYGDMLSSYSAINKLSAKTKLADDVRSEFIDLGSEAKNLVNSMNIFSVNSYKSTIQKIIDIDNEMNRKLVGLAKMNIFPL